jgi:hypothetical protein
VFKQRKVWLVVFIVLSVFGMVARYYHQRSERERMERTRGEFKDAF